jgi:hypothetical protein
VNYEKRAAQDIRLFEGGQAHAWVETGWFMRLATPPARVFITAYAPGGCCSRGGSERERNERQCHSPLNPPVTFFMLLVVLTHIYKRGIPSGHAVYKVSRLRRDAVYTSINALGRF